MLMKSVLTVFCSLILFQSVTFAQGAKTDVSADSADVSGRNIIWINGDIGLVRQTDYHLSDHIQPVEKRNHPYYAAGWTYDYRFDEYEFVRFGLNYSRYKVKFSESEESYDLGIHNAEITTFDPYIGLRFISPDLFPDFKVFLDFGPYWSIISVKNDVKWYINDEYKGSHSESFNDKTNFGVFIGLGSLYKFNDKIISSLSFNVKWPTNNQSVYDEDIYEEGAAEYHPLFLYASFSVGYMFK